MFVESLTSRRCEQMPPHLRAWIEPGATALIVRQDLQRKIRKIGEEIRSKRIANIEITTKLIENLAEEIQTKKDEHHHTNHFSRQRFTEEASRRSAVSILNIVRETFNSKEKIESIGQPDQSSQLDHIASLICDSPTETFYGRTERYQFLCETRKNNFRRLAITALDVIVNPKKIR